MEVLTLKGQSSELRMSSREIAELTGKQHKNILRDIRNMEPAWEKVNGLKFELVEYLDEKGEKRPEYQLNKEETLYVATKYHDETRAKLIMRWKQLEVENVELKSKLNSKTYTIPEDYAEALLRIVDHVRTEKELTDKIKEDAPKVEYYTKVMASTDTVTATTIAKDYGMTAAKFNALLHNLGVQFKQDGQWVLYNKYQNKGYTKSETIPIQRFPGVLGSATSTKWTQIGREFLYHFLKDNNIIPESEKKGKKTIKRKK
jgi:phage regulatory protein, rha family